MSWKKTDAENERKELVKAWLSGRHTIVDLARGWGVSERVAHKTIARFKEEGWPGLIERSRARHTQVRTSELLAAMIVDARRSHPDWGPKKLRTVLQNAHPDEVWPAASTIGSILCQHGLVEARRRRRARAMPTHPCVDAVRPNDSWSMDYKGQFKTRDGRWCYPFTVTDNASRYILKCKGLAAPRLKETWAELVSIFREHGLPTALRSDNGTPFAGGGLTRLSTISVRLMRLDVLPDFIAPGKPQQNGRHERMHRTLKQSTASPPAGSRSAQQRRFNEFVDEFNNVRPHEALGNLVPAVVHVPSRRQMPENLPRIEYDEGEITRAVKSDDGTFKWNAKRIFLAEPLAGERVAFDPIDDGLFLVRFAKHPIAVFDERILKLFPAGNRPGATHKQHDLG